MSLPVLSLAFSAGLIAFLNPCGFSLLPVYLAYYFKNEGLENKSTLKKLFYAVIFGGIVSIGFIILFALVGLLVSAIGSRILKYSVLLDFLIGILLVVIGVIFLFGWNSKINFGIITNLGEKLKANKVRNQYISFFLYGVGFAIASLGCTLPIFLVVVTAAVKENGILNGILVFLTYAFGMSIFMIAFTIIVALSKKAIEQKLKKWLPFIYRLGAVIVIIAGLYLIYSQIIIGVI